ncbi:MAG: hypothetical protein ABI855_19870 [Bacteroidota bacterium]
MIQDLSILDKELEKENRLYDLLTFSFLDSVKKHQEINNNSKVVIETRAEEMLKEHIKKIYQITQEYRDKDGDGVYDFEDNCPTEIGAKSNVGCPGNLYKR